MPRRNSPSLENCCCSNAPQSKAAEMAAVVLSSWPLVALVIELQLPRSHTHHMLRLIYICPAVSTVAGVITIVAYCKRIPLGYIIALALNGMSSLGWIVTLGWLIISWSTSSGDFAMLDVSEFIAEFFIFLFFIGVTLAFEAYLYCAYVDSKNEAHSSNSVDHPLVPETSMNPDSDENEDLSEA